jgi:hypothetical protein
MTTTTQPNAASASATEGTLNLVQQVALRIGTGQPGAYTLNLRLMYDPTDGNVQGMGEIVQGGVQGRPIRVNSVTGQVFRAPGQRTMTLSLSGTCASAPPMPILGSFLAHLQVDDNWNGQGSYRFFATTVNDVPVTHI